MDDLNFDGGSVEGVVIEVVEFRDGEGGFCWSWSGGFFLNWFKGGFNVSGSVSGNLYRVDWFDRNRDFFVCL